MSATGETDYLKYTREVQEKENLLEEAKQELEKAEEGLDENSTEYKHLERQCEEKEDDLEDHYTIMTQALHKHIGKLVTRTNDINNMLPGLEIQPAVDLEEEIDYDNIMMEAEEEMRNQTSMADYDTLEENLEESQTIDNDDEFNDDYQVFIDELTDQGRQEGYEELIETIGNTIEATRDKLSIDSFLDQQYNNSSIKENIKEMDVKTRDDGSKIGEFENTYIETVGTALVSYGLKQELRRIKNEYRAGSVPEPDPEPEPTFDPDPEPGPDTTPDEPGPEPTFDPDPEPGPEPEPDPEPTFEPEPDPEPDTTPDDPGLTPEPDEEDYNLGLMEKVGMAFVKTGKRLNYGGDE